MKLAPIVPGKIAPRHMLVDVPKLVSAYYTIGWRKKVEFGTSGHRGTSLNGSFNEMHIAAITQAICDYRVAKKITGPLFLGFDTHALSIPAFRTALEVLAANDVEVVINKNDEYSPTPVISRMIINYNRQNPNKPADGIVITPSHNGPQDGGFKYNPPHGGPADTEVTNWIQDRANTILEWNNAEVKRIPYERARLATTTHESDFVTPFVNDLAKVIDMEAIKNAGIKIGVDPMGGSGIHYWDPIAEKYGLNLTIVNEIVDPTFSFMTVDTDKTIRMDCSSPDAMASLIDLKDKYDIAFGNDPDYDRHGIVTSDGGLMNPNHYLSVAIWYLLQNRNNWKTDLKIGKTAVSSSMIDKVVSGFNRELYEVPVGFKWFVNGLLEGWLAFGGEESAGASLLQMNGQAWTTDKDGFSLDLLAAEILAKTGKTPSQIYSEVLVAKYGNPFYQRVDGPITDEQKSILKQIRPDSIEGTIAGQRIAKVIIKASGNNASLGGIKVILEDGSWFALRPSGTEPKMKFYIESWSGKETWEKIYAEAPKLIFERNK